MDKRLKILISNDDGIDSEGIWRLARLASELGDVWVCAPVSQCSAMSQRLTIFNELIIKEYAPPVPVRGAYSISGTPADCVKLAVSHLLPEKPDYVFSGINCGYNAGFDIAYSGTIGAAMEGVMNGIPAIAFSAQHDGSFDVAEAHLLPIARELIALGQDAGEVWNVNFPGCALEDFKGILRGRSICKTCLYDNKYTQERLPDGSLKLTISGKPVSPDTVPEGCDVRAVLDGYISIGKVRSMVL